MRSNGESILFHLTTQERAALVETLETYPVVPPAHHSLSKELNDSRVAECQRLLDEALAEQRAANKSHLEAWLALPARFQKNKAGYRFTLLRTDCEWLLQVLNDIRVGHWLRLGSPEPGTLKPQNLDATQVRAWMVMELSGYFQMSILQALARN